MPKGRPLVFFTRPEHAKEIFAGDPEIFHAGKGNAILGPVMGEHSLLLQDGAEHKRARKLLMPAFNGHALRTYQDMVTAIARDEVAHWPEGQQFRCHDRMNVLTLEVILRVVFGVTDEKRLAALRPRVNATVNVSPAVLLVWTLPALHRVGPWKAAVQNQVELDELMYAEIRERRTAPDLAERTDVLSRLIREGEETGDPLSDMELRDQLVTLLLAGHETTATALAWALYELGRDPELMRRTQAAADAGDADGDAWLDAVLKESMRLHPVIPMVVRTLMKPQTIAGIDIPRGATVGPSILDRAQPRGQLRQPRAVRPRAVPRPQPADQHLDPVRRRRTPLHRRRLRDDGGRGGAARGVPRGRRHHRRHRRAPGPQHHLGAEAGRPHQGHPAAERPRDHRGLARTRGLDARARRCAAPLRRLAPRRVGRHGGGGARGAGGHAGPGRRRGAHHRRAAWAARRPDRRRPRPT